jgi:hypothetical protein
MLTLRPYQQAAITSIYGYFEKESGNPLVVIPTAGGKSLVMAAFIDGVLKAWPDQRVLVVTHVRELIAQNHAEMLGLWPEAPAGIYSAGLGRRDARARILFAGIQSIHDKATRIGHADLVLIDEAHLIPGRSNTMYRRFLNDLQAINPALKVIGLTATPFRLDSGMLHEGENALFTDIAYEVSVRDLIDQGYLSPLISKQTQTRCQNGCRSLRRLPGRVPKMTHAFPSMRCASRSRSTAGWPKWTTFAPDLESGRRRTRSARSTYAHFNVMISFSRQPVRISRRAARMAEGSSILSASISRSTSPIRRSSAALRKRSRFSSGYFRMCFRGLVPSGRRPHISARLNIFETTSRQRFA